MGLEVLLAFFVPVATALFLRALRMANGQAGNGGWVGKLDPVTVPATKNARRQALRRALAVAKIGADWLPFFEQTAWRESGFKPHLMNTSVRESAAAMRSVDRNRGRLDALGFPADEWGFGSAGLFQGLGPVVPLDVVSEGNPQGRYRFPPEFINSRGPLMARDPGVAVAFALDFAAGLMRWGNYKGSFASLNVGWKNPSKMGRASSIASSLASMETRAAGLGWPKGWGMARPSKLPDLSRAQMKALAIAARSAYESGVNA